MTEDEISDALRDAIQGVIGTAPFVLVYDNTPMDELLDGDRTYFASTEPNSQPAYTSLGLLMMAQKTYEPREER